MKKNTLRSFLAVIFLMPMLAMGTLSYGQPAETTSTEEKAPAAVPTATEEQKEAVIEETFDDVDDMPLDADTQKEVEEEIKDAEAVDEDA